MLHNINDVSDTCLSGNYMLAIDYTLTLRKGKTRKLTLLYVILQLQTWGMLKVKLNYLIINWHWRTSGRVHVMVQNTVWDKWTLSGLFAILEIWYWSPIDFVMTVTSKLPISENLHGDVEIDLRYLMDKKSKLQETCNFFKTGIRVKKRVQK